MDQSKFKKIFIQQIAVLLIVVFVPMLVKHFLGSTLSASKEELIIPIIALPVILISSLTFWAGIIGVVHSVYIVFLILKSFLQKQVIGSIRPNVLFSIVAIVLAFFEFFYGYHLLANYGV